jgi:hypothetical protein
MVVQHHVGPEVAGNPRADGTDADDADRHRAVSFRWGTRASRHAGEARHPARADGCIRRR